MQPLKRLGTLVVDVIEGQQEVSNVLYVHGNHRLV